MFDFDIISLVMFLFLLSLIFSCFYFDVSGLINNLKKKKALEIIPPSFLGLKHSVFYKAKCILNDDEKNLYLSLTELVGEDYIIFTKIYFLMCLIVFHLMMVLY
ncbi:hypothetical protein GT147_004746 [Salmonella enterica]|nr:hypothetical protein [Salmonella enterica subsp. enterica serovar Infantis]EDW6859492.1 hypothetical protein [Salmonella enterica]EEJ5736484.1 hypothetical protein [Salmonella enterica]